MLSKILTRHKAAFPLRKVGFSSLKKTITELFNNQPHINDPLYKIAKHDPLQPIQSHQVIVKSDQKPRYEITKLNNGVTVLTESIVFPNVIDLGILVNVGTRDENMQTSGSLHLLKDNYQNIILHLDKYNRALHTGGGELEMEYDQENTYIKANCLSHHVDNVLSAMIDSAIRTIPDGAANECIQKSLQQQALMEQMGAAGEDLNDRIMRSAYGLQGLGMPLSGLRDSLAKMTVETLQSFQQEIILPEKVYIAAAGVEDHKEFVKLVESKLDFLQAKSGRNRKVVPSEYKGGESRNENGGTEVTVALAFQAVPWTHQDIFAFQVMNTILGSSASFSTGGPGKGMHSRATKNLLNRLSYVDSANSLCTNFSDSGVFGLILSGPESNSTDLLKALVNELKGLSQPISPIELQRAKNITKSNILMALERQKDRLEEAVKNVKTFGHLRFEEYCSNIDKVTSYQINSAVAKMLSSAPTFVAEGGGINRLPSYDKIQNMVKL